MEQQTSFHCHTCGIDRFPLHRKSSRCFRNSKHALTSLFHSFTFLSSLRVPMSHSLAWWLRSRTGEWANPSFFERIKWYTSTRSMWENNTGVKKGTVLHCKKYFDIENRLRVPRQYFATHLVFLQSTPLMFMQKTLWRVSYIMVIGMQKHDSKAQPSQYPQYSTISIDLLLLFNSVKSC